ncbi:unnamed protein product [Brassica rapa]|uniref:Uncharacterized protein n=1 Tax=Brassica campestris TaxID=3711 RepID=A0A8D9CRF2_BRACM|nr:unnamed protein product [Brassica rapa]
MHHVFYSCVLIWVLTLSPKSGLGTGLGLMCILLITHPTPFVLFAGRFR